ncbi:MAG: carbohydrate binding family 9 domain-containing protein, partial [Vicinamibacterales bacterium]
MLRFKPAPVALALALICSALNPAQAQAQQVEPDVFPKTPGAPAPIDYGTARQTRRLEAVRTAGEITLDGALDEPAWSNAPVAHGFIQNDPHEGDPATFDTEVRVLYDDEALYFGVFAKDDDPAAIIVNDLKKDFDTGNDDGFRLVIDTFRDERNGYQFATNPAGAKWDAQMANEGRENNANWDGIWEVRTRIA